MNYAKGIKEFIDRSNNVLLPNFYKLPLERQRAMYLGLITEFPYDLPNNISIKDEHVIQNGRKIPYRIYRPKEKRGSGLLIYLRGDGFVLGSLETHNSIVAELCEKTGLVTITPDCRMAPEHPFPSALEDCYGVLCGIVEEAHRLGIDRNRIVITGDSSGANMAVVICMMCRDRGGPKLKGQALISPVLDLARWSRGGDDTPLLTGGEMQFFFACYSPDPDQIKHPYVSPLIDGTFHDLPPAYIMATEMDSLLIDSEKYTQQLIQHGIDVELVIEPGLIHSPARARMLSPQVADAWERFCRKAAKLASRDEFISNTISVNNSAISDPNGPAVIVDPYSSGTFFAPAFSKNGVPVVALVSSPNPPDVYAYAYCPNDFQQIITVSEDLSETIAQLKKLKPRCVIPGCESGVELADAVSPHVVADLANLPGKASARRHKGDMATAVSEAGLPVIAQICTHSSEEVEAWLQQEELEGRDLVIKPPKSASTDGVVRISQGIGWRKVFEELLGKPNRLGIINENIVVQEYIVGMEYVVDTMSYQGKHSVSDICQYHKIDNGPHMAIYDRMEWLSPDVPVYNDLINYAKGVLDAVGMRFGTGHVEIMLTDHGPKLIEVASRPHGGGHPRFCRIATGDSQVDRTVRYFSRTGSIPESFELKKNVMIVFLICKKTGKVTNAEIFDELHKLESHSYSVVNFQNEDWLEPTKDLFASLDLGFVALVHEDQHQIMVDYKKIRSLEEQLIFEPTKEYHKKVVESTAPSLLLTGTNVDHRPEQSNFNIAIIERKENELT